MKQFLFLILCLCWLMISCSSTPPAEEVVQEQVLDQEVPEEPALEESVLEEQALEETMLEEEVLEGDDLTVAVPEASAMENNSLDTASEFLSSADIHQEEKGEDQDYLQEIEIIDLLQDSSLPTDSQQEDMAVVVESEAVVDSEEDGALIVEIPGLQKEEIPLSESILATEEDVALVVESVDEVESEETQEAPILDETKEELALEQENDIIPEDINETQGVLEDVIVPSRSVVMDKNQYLDIRYPGSGWVYLGEVTQDGTSIGADSLTYFGRRRTSEDTSFTMKSAKPGTTILHFFKQDILTATFIDDYLEVTITENIAQSGFRVIAPSYESIVPGYQDIIPQPKDFALAEAPVSETAAEEAETPAVTESAVVPVVPATSSAVAATPAPSSVVNTLAEEVETSVATESAVVPVVPATSSAIAATPAPSSVVNTLAEEVETPVATESAVVPAVPATSSAVATTPAPSSVVKTPAEEVETPVATESAVVPAVPATSSAIATTPAPSSEVKTPAVTESAVVPATTAPVIVPSQTLLENTVSRSSPTQAFSEQPAQVSSVQQEVYQPEPSDSTLAQDNYNPQTGLSMEDLDLPWVNQTLEQQRVADINEEVQESNDQQAQDALLAQAQEHFYAENFPAALASLDEFFEIAVNDFDAAYYLKGQILESKSSIKNIKEAQKAYKHVIDSYPQSPFWERSKNRYTYLSRFYFDIR